MPTTVWPAIRSHVVRVTALDNCGAPVIGPKSQNVSNGHISLKLSPQYEDGEETAPKNAGGKILFVDKAQDELKYFNVELVFSRVEPELFGAMTGQPLVLNSDGEPVGFRIGQSVDANVAIETWTDVPGTVCGPDGKVYGYFLVPWLKGGRLGDFSFENALANFTITARTEMNSPWGAGPYNVVLNAPVAPATEKVPGPLLTPIAADQHIHGEPTPVIYPSPTAGAVALPSP
ncbi:hypothetical protein [Rhodococcus erythropolis]|uniref:hypothetical protein n=1 Tax=Rhodococcus erythropolis TaxID=1833 RepID=UPI00366BF7EB